VRCRWAKQPEDLATRALLEIQVRGDRSSVGVLAALLRGDEVFYDGMARAVAGGSFHRERALALDPESDGVRESLERARPLVPSH
jgi:hypothetical protein